MNSSRVAAVLIAAGSLSAACHHRATSKDYSSPSMSDTQRRSDAAAPPSQPDQPAPMPTSAAGVFADPATAWASPETRILSILHAKDVEEVNAGRIAAQNGTSDTVKKYGEMLVRDHSEHDAKVRTCADATGLRLLEPSDVNRMIQRETGQAPGDPVAELRAVSGTDFDQKFMAMMRDGHQEAIQVVEAAQRTVTNARVGALLAETLPTLRHHLEMAKASDR